MTNKVLVPKSATVLPAVHASVTVTVTVEPAAKLENVLLPLAMVAGTVSFSMTDTEPEKLSLA